MFFPLPWRSKKEEKKPEEENPDYLNHHMTKNLVIIDTINAGSFGEIYLASCVDTGKQFAVKMIKKKHEHRAKNLKTEYSLMHKITGRGLFPEAEYLSPSENYFGQHALVMERLGPNINDLFKICGKRLPHKSVSSLMVQMITRLEELHQCGILHRDIKPDNFCMGGSSLRKVYIIDFGLSTAFTDSEGNHLPKEKGKGFVGTPRYASRNAHYGYTQSRRDDLEALGHMAIYLVKGSLPWQKVNQKDRKKKHEELYEFKSKTASVSLCEGLPNCFRAYLDYCRNLSYAEAPNYSFLKSMFKNSLSKTDNRYAWESYNEFLALRSEFLNGGREEASAVFTETSYNCESSQMSQDFHFASEDIGEEGLPEDYGISIAVTPGNRLAESNLFVY